MCSTVSRRAPAKFVITCSMSHKEFQGRQTNLADLHHTSYNYLEVQLLLFQHFGVKHFAGHSKRTDQHYIEYRYVTILQMMTSFFAWEPRFSDFFVSKFQTNQQVVFMSCLHMSSIVFTCEPRNLRLLNLQETKSCFCFMTCADSSIQVSWHYLDPQVGGLGGS